MGEMGLGLSAGIAWHAVRLEHQRSDHDYKAADMIRQTSPNTIGA